MTSCCQRPRQEGEKPSLFFCFHGSFAFPLKFALGEKSALCDVTNWSSQSEEELQPSEAAKPEFPQENVNATKQPRLVFVAWSTGQSPSVVSTPAPTQRPQLIPSCPCLFISSVLFFFLDSISLFCKSPLKHVSKSSGHGGPSFLFFFFFPEHFAEF